MKPCGWTTDPKNIPLRTVNNPTYKSIPHRLMKVKVVWEKTLEINGSKHIIKAIMGPHPVNRSDVRGMVTQTNLETRVTIILVSKTLPMSYDTLKSGYNHHKSIASARSRILRWLKSLRRKWDSGVKKRNTASIKNV